MHDFEHLDPDDCDLALLDIVATINMELTRPVLLISQRVGVAFCDLGDDALAFTRDQIGCRRVAAVALKHRIDLWYDEEYLDSGNPENPAAVLLTRDLDYEDGIVRVHGSAIATGVDREGETVPLNQTQVRALVHWFLARLGDPGDLHIARADDLA